jgi:hypothetical protein
VRGEGTSPVKDPVENILLVVVIVERFADVRKV